LKQTLLSKEDLIARHLVKSMLAYACGRKPGPFDRGEVDCIVGALATNNYPLRGVVHAVTTSRLFLRPEQGISQDTSQAAHP
jgi:hypothetical protein